jgi:predicted RNase H-like HicB family nuclease
MNTAPDNNVTLILEKNGNKYWVTIPELKGCYTVGSSIDETINNAANAIKEYIEDIPEGQEIDPRFFVPDFKFNIKYDLQVFFEKFNFLNKTAIAERAGLNPSLLRQYSKGIAFASEKQKAKIEKAIHEIAESLLEASL